MSQFKKQSLSEGLQEVQKFMEGWSVDEDGCYKIFDPQNLITAASEHLTIDPIFAALLILHAAELLYLVKEETEPQPIVPGTKYEKFQFTDQGFQQALAYLREIGHIEGLARHFVRDQLIRRANTIYSGGRYSAY